MVRIQSVPTLSPLEEEKLSVLASIARLEERAPFFTRIARFRRWRNPYRLHQKNVDTVERFARRIGSESLGKFASECEALINSKLGK